VFYPKKFKVHASVYFLATPQRYPPGGATTCNEVQVRVKHVHWVGMRQVTARQLLNRRQVPGLENLQLGRIHTADRESISPLGVPRRTELGRRSRPRVVGHSGPFRLGGCSAYSSRPDQRCCFEHVNKWVVAHCHQIGAVVRREVSPVHSIRVANSRQRHASLGRDPALIPQAYRLVVGCCGKAATTHKSTRSSQSQRQLKRQQAKPYKSSLGCWSTEFILFLCSAYAAPSTDCARRSTSRKDPSSQLA
jgi:hypothetical protein